MMFRYFHLKFRPPFLVGNFLCRGNLCSIVILPYNKHIQPSSFFPRDEGSSLHNFHPDLALLSFDPAWGRIAIHTPFFVRNSSPKHSGFKKVLKVLWDDGSWTNRILLERPYFLVLSGTFAEGLGKNLHRTIRVPAIFYHILPWKV